MLNPYARYSILQFIKMSFILWKFHSHWKFRWWKLFSVRIINNSWVFIQGHSRFLKSREKYFSSLQRRGGIILHFYATILFFLLSFMVRQITLILIQVQNIFHLFSKLYGIMNNILYTISEKLVFSTNVSLL